MLPGDRIPGELLDRCLQLVTIAGHYELGVCSIRQKDDRESIVRTNRLGPAAETRVDFRFWYILYVRLHPVSVW